MVMEGQAGDPNDYFAAGKFLKNEDPGINMVNQPGASISRPGFFDAVAGAFQGQNEQYLKRLLGRA